MNLSLEIEVLLLAIFVAMLLVFAQLARLNQQIQPLLSSTLAQTIARV